MIDLTRFSENPVGVPPSTSGSLIKVSSYSLSFSFSLCTIMLLFVYMYILNNSAVCMAIVLCDSMTLIVTTSVCLLSIICPIMQCSYVIDVAVHVPWAPDIEVRQPLLIKPPPNVIVSQLPRTA
jgi:hypothetical protein